MVADRRQAHARRRRDVTRGRVRVALLDQAALGPGDQVLTVSHGRAAYPSVLDQRLDTIVLDKCLRRLYSLRHDDSHHALSQLQARAGRREWTGLGVLLLPLLLVSMDVSVLYFAVPFISRDLQPSSTQQLWIFDVYGFVLAGLLITMGSLGDRIGRRRLLLTGAAAFSLASLGAAYSHTAGQLIAARAVLGIAGATLMPSTLALIRNMFHDEKQRRTAIAIWTGATMSGIALGPVLSGFLLNHFWWGSVFLINVPFMVMLLALAPALVPEFRAPQAGRFDLVGSVLSLGAVLPAIYGIKEIAANGLDLARAACDRGRRGRRRRVHPPAGAQLRADDRPEAVPQPGLHRVGRDEPGVDVRDRRVRHLHHAVPPVGARDEPVHRRAVVAGADGRDHGGRAAHPGARCSAWTARTSPRAGSSIAGGRVRRAHPAARALAALVHPDRRHRLRRRHRRGHDRSATS